MEELTICMVHPGALPVTVYRALAAALSPRIGLIIIEMRLLREYGQAMTGGRRDVTVEALARGLAAQLPRGRNCVLAGWSFGGLVALALADRPEQAAPLDRVVLLDTVASWRDIGLSERTVRPHQALTWFCMLLGARVYRPFPIDPMQLRGALDDALSHIRVRGIEQGVLPPDTTVPWLHELFAGFVNGIRSNGRMAEAFRPRRMPSRLILVKPQGSLFPRSPALGWRPLAGPGLRLVSCPGNHYSLLTDPLALARLATVFRSLASDLARPADGATRPWRPQASTFSPSDEQGRFS
jgi:pimeloyl-ACP methyl ester carboxylesterase